MHLLRHKVLASVDNADKDGVMALEQSIASSAIFYSPFLDWSVDMQATSTEHSVPSMGLWLNSVSSWSKGHARHATLFVKVPWNNATQLATLALQTAVRLVRSQYDLLCCLPTTNRT